MAKKSGSYYTKQPLASEHHFATSDECEARDKQTKRRPATSFTQIGPEGEPGLNLAEPNPRNISGPFKLGNSPF
jgi:hypothetical protein